MIHPRRVLNFFENKNEADINAIVKDDNGKNRHNHSRVVNVTFEMARDPNSRHTSADGGDSEDDSLLHRYDRTRYPLSLPLRTRSKRTV